jgi:hypothetical protein
MRSRTARLATGAVAWLAIGAAAFFLVRSDQQITASRAAFRAFDLHAREATDALADLRVAQQAYVADGQGVAFWMPKVAATTDVIRQAIASLSESARSAAALSSDRGTVGICATVCGEYPCASIGRRSEPDTLPSHTTSPLASIMSAPRAINL